MRSPINTPVFIALGGNLGDVPDTFRMALRRLHRLGLSVQKLSSLYRTRALKAPEETRFIPDYWNAVCQVSTALCPRRCLETLLGIENEAGRVREGRWGPRSLDLDLLLFGGEQIAEEGLVVPHPRMRERLFVMAPLAEIGAEFKVMPDGKSVGELCAALSGDAHDILEVRSLEVGYFGAAEEGL